jgi:hypothetical protein
MSDLRLEIDDQLSIGGWTIGIIRAITNHQVIVNLRSDI